jgi:hypothetical protein
MREFLSRVKGSDPCRVSGSVQHRRAADAPIKDRTGDIRVASKFARAPQGFMWETRDLTIPSRTWHQWRVRA